VNTPTRHFNVLHLIVAIRATNGQYNEHCLPLADQRHIAICTYFKSEIKPFAKITLYEGDNSLRGFFRALKAALRDGEYEVIHAHAPHTGFLLLVGIFIFGKYRKLMPSTVYTVQNSYQNYKFRNRVLMIPAFAFFRKLVCCSNACRESLPFFLKWLGGDRIHVVQNAVNIDRVERVIGNNGAHFKRVFETTDRSLNGRNFGRSCIKSDRSVTFQTLSEKESFTIASVGRLIEIKNPLALLQAFHQSHNPASRLVFIGEGHLRPKLIQEIKRLGLERQVALTGLIGRDEVYDRLAKADLFVSASRGEGLPVAVIEAMACGCPVILSDIPPHREIGDEVDFIPLIQPDDATGFAREIKRFRQMPTSERTEIGKRCKKLVEERFSLAAMHKGYEKIYAQV